MVLVAVTPTVVTTFCVLRDWLSQAAIRGSCGGAVVERIGMNNSGNAIDCELSMGRIQWSRVQQPPRLDSTSVMPVAWRLAAQLCTNGHCVRNYFLFENTKTLVKSTSNPLKSQDSHTGTITCQKTFHPQRTSFLQRASGPAVGRP
jgi:hypothetical protein